MVPDINMMRLLKTTANRLKMFLQSYVDDNFLSVQKKTGQDSTARSGFAINFGQSVTGSGPKGIEGEMMAHLLKPLVSRLMDMWKELHGHENIVSHHFISIF